jgi:hypothetical protein
MLQYHRKYWQQLQQQLRALVVLQLIPPPISFTYIRYLSIIIPPGQLFELVILILNCLLLNLKVNCLIPSASIYLQRTSIPSMILLSVTNSDTVESIDNRESLQHLKDADAIEFELKNDEPGVNHTTIKWSKWTDTN